MEHMERGGTPLVIAHRGMSAHAPENTFAAFQMAIDAGADGIEFDVQLAKDGVPVVIHDSNLKRTGRRSENIADLTSNQLGKIDVGSWFNAKHRKRARPEFESETVQTLTSVLTLLSGFKGRIYVELKCELTNFKPLAAAVAEIIRSSPLLPQMIIQSFRLAVIPEIRCLLPALATAALFEPSIVTILRRRTHIVAIAREFGADQLSLHHTLITAKLASLAAQTRMPIAVWTVNNAKWIARSKRLGIDGLITNDPARMLAGRR
jgi:glycerophosphoryl diester phosphodiesterase